MDTDRNLLFGVLALQADLIDSRQFIEACTLWTTRKDATLADVLVERGWLRTEDRSCLDYLLQRKLEKNAGDAGASLASMGDDVKRSLAALGDADIERSLVGLPGPMETPILDATTDLETQERYALSRLHATGGIGRVWLARDNRLGRDVALKELRPEQAHSAAHCARFLKEARITGQLEHPGIVPVYELARRPASQQPFYTMRFVKGRTLTEAARDYHARRLSGQADALELPALLNAFVAVCNTVAYAHSRGVIHRDLKGHNVVLGDFGEVVVLDWGLAKVMRQEAAAEHEENLLRDDGATDSGLTAHGQALGTPAYMAPEQAAGRLELIDQRTDVHGLGAMLYEILTGLPPFTGADTREVLRKVREEEPPPPEQICADAPSALAAACLRALSKQPADRYAGASDLAREIQQWQEVQRLHAEEALRASEALYHSLVESIPLNVWRKDVEGRFTFVNQGFCDAAQRTREEVIGKTDLDLFPEPLALKYRSDDARVLQTGQTLRATEEHTTSRGEKLFVEVIKIPIYDPRGEIVGTQGIFWDLTGLQRAATNS
jgi:PAS domain S-box-containing protein